MFLLAWKNLTQNRTQFLLSVGGVALALLLMLSLDALLAGSEEDLVAYIEGSGADIFISQEGVKNMHMAASAITEQNIRKAAHAPGVASASPILYTTGVIKAGEADILSYVIGFDPGEVGSSGAIEYDNLVEILRLLACQNQRPFSFWA